MVKEINRDKVKEMKNKEDVKIVEVLSEDQFEKGHIRGAINIPVDKIEAKAPKKLDRDEKVIVYCANTECQASPKAAKKLEKMGYKHVYDYPEGKADWNKAGYPMAFA